MKLFVFIFAMLAVAVNEQDKKILNIQTLPSQVFCKRDRGQRCKGTKIDIGGNQFLCEKNGKWVHEVFNQKKTRAGVPGGAQCTDAANTTCFADRGHCNQYTIKGEEMDRVCPGTCGDTSFISYDVSHSNVLFISESCDGCRCQDANHVHKYCPFWAQYCDSPGSAFVCHLCFFCALMYSDLFYISLIMVF